MVFQSLVSPQWQAEVWNERKSVKESWKSDDYERSVPSYGSLVGDYFRMDSLQPFNNHKNFSNNSSFFSLKRIFLLPYVHCKKMWLLDEATIMRFKNLFRNFKVIWARLYNWFSLKPIERNGFALLRVTLVLSNVVVPGCNCYKSTTKTADRIQINIFSLCAYMYIWIYMYV